MNPTIERKIISLPTMQLDTIKPAPIFVIEPKSQSEIINALEKLKERYTVVLNLSYLEPIVARQAADMMAGCSCAINGKATWIGEQTYVYTPDHVALNK